MPQLIDRNGPAEDIWTVLGAEDALPDGGPVIVPLERLGAALGQRIGPGFGYDELPGVIEKIVDTYLDLRDGARETFLQTYRRVGMEPFKEALYATAH